jgi:hypothetical protein
VIKKIIVFLFCQVFFLSTVYSAEEKTIQSQVPSKNTFISTYLKNVGLGIGGLNTSPFTSVKNQDKKNIFDPNLALYLTGRWNIKNSLYFAPEFSYVIFPTFQNEYSKNITVYSLVFMSNVWRDLFLRYGVSTFITTVYGNGGTKVLNDGGTTSTFYLPGDVGKSYNTALTFGAENVFKEHWALRLDTYIVGVLSKTARQLSYSTSVHYYF